MKNSKGIRSCILFFAAALFFAWTFSYGSVQASAESIHDGLDEVANELSKGQDYVPMAKGLDESGEAFDEYVEAASGEKGVRGKIKKTAGIKLTGVDKAIYNKLMVYIIEVAAGERASTIFEVSMEDLGFDQQIWTAADLGVDSLIDGGSIAEDAVAALSEIGDYDLKKIINALLADNPYGLYWYDKTADIGGTGYGMTVYYDDELDDYVIGFTGTLSFCFPVSVEYSAGDYLVDTEIGQSVQTIVDKANAIVAEYASASDLEKLNGYRQEICDLVSYNDDAAAGGIAYGNPWQLIWVFDEDANTNVVCEGYAKSFQYLCNLTDFSGDIDCITVTGTMDGGTGAGAHMWNIVTMEDGNNYLVDVTNCDEGTIGYKDQLFLVTFETGNVVDGYSFKYEDSSGFGDGLIFYSYDSETKQLYNDTELTIAESGQKQQWGNFTYYVNSGKAHIVKYSGNSKTVVIPNLVDGYKVASVEQFAIINDNVVETISFEEGIERIDDGGITSCSSLQTIHFPSTIMISNSGAFAMLTGCDNVVEVTVPANNENLTVVNNALCSKDLKILYYYPRGRKDSSVSLPDGVEYINSNAFSSMPSIEKVVLPNTLKRIGMAAFSSCESLSEINIPEGCEMIEQEAFGFTGLTQLKIPSTVSFIGSNIGIGSLITEYIVDENNMNFYDIDGVLYMDKTLLRYPVARQDEEFTIPDMIDAISNAAFFGSKYLKKIVVGKGIQDLPNEAFGYIDCLEELVISDSVQNISLNAFVGLNNLKKIEVDENNTCYSSVDGILLNKEQTEIIYYPKLKGGTITVPEGVRSLNDGLFSNANEIETVILPDSLLEIPAFCFSNCPKLETVVFGENIKVIGESAFQSCSSIRSIVVPSNVTTIGNSAFNNCENLEEVVVGEGLSELGVRAFIRCFKLEKITVSPNNRFFRSDNGLLFDYNGNKVYWCSPLREGIVDLPETVNCICEEAFSQCHLVTGIAGGMICDIEKGAFFDSFIERLVLSQGSGEIGEEAFYYCQLRFLDVSSDISSIANRALYAESLEKVVIRNPDCYIENDKDTIHENTIIYGYSGSTAERYAITYERKFVDITNETICHTGHILSRDMGAWYPPSCEENGYKEGLCIVCEKNVKEYTDELALGHELTPYEAVEASCTEVGNSAYWRCERCGKYFSDEAGEAEIEVDSWTIDALGHDYEGTVTAPTCTERGYTTYTCTRCGDSYIDDHTEATGHNWGEPEVAKEVTYEEDGELLYTCSNCGETRTETIPAKRHEWSEGEVTTEPTCTETGVKTYICAECDELWLEQIPALGHYYGEEVTTAPTCTERGYTSHTCERCGDSYQDNYTEALGHSWDAGTVTKTVTVTEAGEILYTCSVCGAERTEAILATAADVILWIDSLPDSPGAADGEAVAAVRAAYEALDDAQKALISSTVLAKLADAEEKVAKAKAAEQKAETTTKAKPVLVKSIKVTGISKKIAAGKKIKLTAKVLPVKASNKKLTWTSSNKKLATVTQTGLVKIAKKAKPGKTVKITARAKDGSGKKQVFKIKIMKGAVKKITVTGYKKTLKAGKSMQLKAQVKTTKGTPVNNKLKWISSKPKYAKVSQNGKVTALAAGKGKTVKITVMSTDGTNKKVVKSIKIK